MHAWIAASVKVAERPRLPFRSASQTVSSQTRYAATRAAVIVGSIPTGGGIGTIVGGIISAVIVSFLHVGVMSAGLDGFYAEFFNGLIIILALFGQRWNQIRYL